MDARSRWQRHNTTSSSLEAPRDTNPNTKRTHACTHRATETRPRHKRGRTDMGCSTEEAQGVDARSRWQRRNTTSNSCPEAPQRNTPNTNTTHINTLCLLGGILGGVGGSRDSAVGVPSNLAD